ncbi:L,D-transpeptidase family protein [Streptomyces sp. SGAir0957]
MNTRTRLAPVLLAATIVGGLATTATAPAQAQPAAASSYYLKFNKSTNTNSTLSLMKSVSGPDKVIKKYRAGSGVSRDECASLRGWLPTKTYKINKWYKTLDRDKIKGYAFHLNNATCKNGRTVRTDLFIHSEMTKNGGEDRRDERWRWDGNSDYKSAGCIKLKPSDIKDLYKRGKALGFPKKLVVTN